MNNGWIKIYRKMLDNPVVMKDADHLAVWMYLLLKATHDEYPVMFGGKKIVLRSGQLITGRKKIADAVGVNESKVFRILKLFKSEQQIEQQTSNQNSLISILNWELYQTCEQQNEQRVNNQCTTDEQRVNTNKNVKNVNNEKKHIYGAFKKVRLTDSEKDRLIADYGQVFFAACVKELDEYKEQTGKTYKNDNLAIRKWVVDAVKKKGGIVHEYNSTEQRAEYGQIVL